MDAVFPNYHTEITIKSISDVLNVPLVKAYYDCLNDHYQRCIRQYLALTPQIPAYYNSYSQFKSRTEYRHILSKDKIRHACELINEFLTLQFIEFDLQDYFNGKEYCSEYFFLSHTFIAATLQGDDADNLLNILHNIFYQSESVQYIDSYLIAGILQSTNQQAIDMVLDLLKAARLSEGLRSTIIYHIDKGTADTFKLFVQCIKDYNLQRFSSVKQAILNLVHLCDVVDNKNLNIVCEYMIECVIDNQTEAYLLSEDPLKVYIALYAMGLSEINDSFAYIEKTHQHVSSHIRATYLYFIYHSDIGVNSKLLTYTLINDTDENNLFLVMGNLPKISFSDDDDKREYVIAFLTKLALVKSKSVYQYLGKNHEVTYSISKAYQKVLEYVHELDDLYEEAYRLFDAHSGQFCNAYNMDDSIKEIKHPSMRRVLIEGINSKKSDMRSYAYKKIIKLELNLTYDECLTIANGMKSKVSSIRKNISKLLSLQDENTIITIANLLLDDKNKLKQVGAIGLLVDNLERLKDRSDFKTTQDKVAKMTFAEDISANINLLVNPDLALAIKKKTTKQPLFFDNSRQFNTPELKYDQALIDELFNVDIANLERVMTEFMAIFSQHNGEDYQYKDYYDATIISKVGSDLLYTGHLRYQINFTDYTKYPFYDESLAKLQEMTDSELFDLEFALHLVELNHRYYGNQLLQLKHYTDRGLVPNIFDDIKDWGEKHNLAELNLRGVFDLNEQYRKEENKNSIYEDAEVNKKLLNYLAFLTKKEQEWMKEDHKIADNKEKCDCRSTDDSYICCNHCSGIFLDHFNDFSFKGLLGANRYKEVECFACDSVDSHYVSSIILNIVQLYKGRSLPFNSSIFFQLIEANALDSDYVYQLIFDTQELTRNTYLERYYGSLILSSISNKFIRTDIAPSPIESEIYHQSTQYMIDIELDRTELDTEYSFILSCCDYFSGTDIFIKALSRMGKMLFIRGYTYGGSAKKGSFSNIIANTRPEDDLTQEKFDDLVREYKIDDNRLLEACLYNFNYIQYAENNLKIKGLVKAAYYFKAHMRSMSEQDTIHIARYSNVDPDDLINGQMDINWFKESYAELGKKNFEKVYDAAKNLTSGGEHKRAQYFADAVMGKLKIKDVEARIHDKRNQDMILVYGLIPLRGDKTNAALKRYKILQDFIKQSKQFGAQRRQSEALKVSIATNNLARNYGLELDRFTWTMEAKLVEKVSESFTPKNIGEVDVYLDLSNVKNPDIVVIKEGKTLKTIPTKYRKHKYITELKEIKKQLKDQYMRARKTLEESMINEDNYSLEDLKQINSHPIVHKLLQDLLFISDDNIGFFKADEKSESSQNENGVLVGVNGDVYSLTNKSILRIAHPVDLATADLMTESNKDSNQSKPKQSKPKQSKPKQSQWPAWQSYVMENAIQQPFKQVFRELYTMTEEEQLNDGFTNRFAGYQIEGLRMMGIMKSRGWVVNHYDGFEKINHKHNLRIDMYCYADWFMPSSIEQPTLEKIIFMDNKTNQSKDMKSLSKIIYSETMRDIDLVVSVAYVGGVDPMLNHTTLEMRKRILEHNLSLFKIDNYTLDDKHIMIKGSFGNYSIHLGSGIIHMEGRGMLPVFPVHSQQRGHIFLPFVDDDPKTSEIMTKVLMLAKDNTIKDPTILMHLK